MHFLLAFVCISYSTGTGGLFYLSGNLYGTKKNVKVGNDTNMLNGCKSKSRFHRKMNTIKILLS